MRGEEGFGDSRAVWSARLILFIGFALMAGGLAGSVVREFYSFRWLHTLIAYFQTVLILKYVLGGYPDQFTYYGYANVAQSIAMMLSAIVLWLAQSASSEFEYNLTL